MSNCEIIELPIVVSDRTSSTCIMYVFDLRCCPTNLRRQDPTSSERFYDVGTTCLHAAGLLHTIIFNRSLGYVKPKDVDSELFDITYVQCSDPDLEARVEAKISEFCTLMEKRPSEAAQLRISFYELRKKAAWFGSKDERLYWEQWYINIAVVQPDLVGQQHYNSTGGGQGLSRRQARKEATLHQAQAEVLRFVNDKRDHIPPVASASLATYPFDIVMAGGSKSAFETKVHEMKKMLMHTAPPPMLS